MLKAYDSARCRNRRMNHLILLAYLLLQKWIRPLSETAATLVMQVVLGSSSGHFQVNLQHLTPFAIDKVVFDSLFLSNVTSMRRCSR